MYMQREITKMTKRLEEVRKKKVAKRDRCSLAGMSFYDFQKAVRPDIDYSSGYAFLQVPIDMMLKGLSIAVKKGSQLGFTEALLSLCLYWLIVQQVNLFYMLPTDRDIVDFTSSRFNPVISSSDILPRLIEIDNVHLKQSGNASLYLRPGMTRAGKPTSKIKSVPVKKLIIDEVDEIPEVTLDIVEERLSGSKEKQDIRGSTPTDASRGIAKELKGRKTLSYFVKCLYCGFEQTIDHELNLDQERAIYFCRSCKKAWSHEQKIEMVRDAANDGWKCVENPDAKKIGIQISQLYSPTVTAEEVVDKINKADNELKKQALYNHKFGLEYSAEGSKLTPDFVEARVAHFYAPSQRIAGIDVSSAGLHYVAIGATVPAGLVVTGVHRCSWGDLPAFLRSKSVTTVVVDQQPEREAVRQFASSCDGVVWKAMYPSGVRELFSCDLAAHLVKIHRTEAIDTVLSRFRNDHICLLPCVYESSEWQHLVSHICSVSRKYREVRGEYEAYYEETGADHYLHSLVYLEIASRIDKGGAFDSVGGNFLKG